MLIYVNSLARISADVVDSVHMKLSGQITSVTAISISTSVTPKSVYNTQYIVAVLTVLLHLLNGMIITLITVANKDNTAVVLTYC